MEQKKYDDEKKLAAEKALTYIKNGMVIGLGSGSTAEFMIRELGKKVKLGLVVKGVPSSERTAKLAQELNIELTTLDKIKQLDVNIDGADEFDGQMRLIKGGGGALLREKIIAHNAKTNIIIADSKKQVDTLGQFKLPIETIPFASEKIVDELSAMGLRPKLRQRDGIVYRTDENNLIIDMDILGRQDLDALNNILISIPGVVETGLFLYTTDLIVMGTDEGVKIFERP